jgi:hypothetical protein
MRSTTARIAGANHTIDTIHHWRAVSFLRIVREGTADCRPEFHVRTVAVPLADAMGPFTY